MSEVRDWNLSETNLGRAEQIPYEIAVLPIGATEAHNLHLPYGTDSIQVRSVAERACERAWEEGAQVVLLPTLPIGVNENTLGFPWTLSFKPSTVLQMLRDIVSCLEHHRLPKLLVLNGHGGNELKALMRELFRHTDVQVVLVDWWTVDPHAMQANFEEPGEHAGEMETSVMMHLNEDLVELDRADEGETRESYLTGIEEGWAWIARPWDRYTTNSGVGNPERANAEKGEKFLDSCVKKIAELIVEMDEREIDEWYPYRSG